MPETIGKYEIIRRIGTGGFGAVYEARDPLLKRTVAVKTCQIDDEEVRARFFREAELAGSLHHRNITTVHDSGIHGDMPYLVQEFLTGEDLDRMIQRPLPLSIARQVEILIGIAYGLEHAHAAGIIHRDIKPANVRVLEDGTVKIMDFGIAKSLRADLNLTDTGVTVGTSAYLAPEQIRGQKADRRTDIFAFGVMAYELLTGRKPFSGETLPQLFDEILRGDPPSVTAVSPRVPPDLAAVVERAMRTDPEKRYPSASELRLDLIAVQRNLGPAAVEPLLPSPLAAADRSPMEPVTRPFAVAGDAPPTAAGAAAQDPQDTEAFESRPSSRRIQAGSRRAVRAAAAAAIVFLALSGAVILFWPSRESSTPRTAEPDPAAGARRAAAAPAPPAELEPPIAPSADPLAKPQAISAANAGQAEESVGAFRNSEIRTRPGRIAVSYDERPVRPRRRLEEPRLPADRYTRAAMEPGLSDETRAHILLQSALSHHQAGDQAQARASLRAAFALAPDLDVAASSYGDRFAEFARSVRSGSQLPRPQR
ncbi:MAG: serine/threonine-protein kinase [Thermoanaerobaculia bacterium]